ncbi:MAG: hemerythrin domain-containing protein [Actinomycetia bacterium]|nr:hemerythrin domain-containing protein [Actinomycetes bacterium]
MGLGSTPTAVLRDEHRLILEVADALDQLFAVEPGGAALDFDAVDRCITFFRLFADACHHTKEEDLLFPELERAGLPHDSGPIAVMLNEHEQGRVFVRAMADAIETARTGESSSLADLRAAADGFVSLIVAHIAKEDGVLFNMADGMIVGPECRELCAAYDTACSRRFEGQSKEDLERLGAAILG